MSNPFLGTWCSVGRCVGDDNLMKQRERERERKVMRLSDETADGVQIHLPTASASLIQRSIHSMISAKWTAPHALRAVSPTAMAC
jgi:hypothetical protein